MTTRQKLLAIPVDRLPKDLKLDRNRCHTGVIWIVFAVEFLILNWIFGPNDDNFMLWFQGLILFGLAVIHFWELLRLKDLAPEIDELYNEIYLPTVTPVKVKLFGFTHPRSAKGGAISVHHRWYTDTGFSSRSQINAGPDSVAHFRVLYQDGHMEEFVEFGSERFEFLYQFVEF